jgi:MFS transporter, FHS family, glucose/mannose:H+ symporter
VTRPQADQSQSNQPQAARPRLILYSLGFLTFFLLGLIQAAYGPAYPNLGREYHLEASVVGTIASLHFAGSAIGTVLLGMLLTRVSLRSGLLLAALALMLGMLGVAFSPAWSWVLAAALFTGIGYGMLSAGFNLAFAELGAGPSNLVNGLFGLGSVASPALVALLAQGSVQGSHRPPFVLMAALAAVLALGVRLLWPRPDTGPARKAGPAGTTSQSVIDEILPVVSTPPYSRRIMALFGLAFFLYVGIEAGLGNWSTTFFTRLYLNTPGANQPQVLTSFYWLSLTVGRFVFAALGNRFSPFQVLVFATVGAMLGGTLMLSSAALAPFGLVLAGFCIAPVFATGLAWFASVQPPKLTPYLLTLGSAGGAVLPALTGWALPRLGNISVPLTPLIIAALLLGVVLMLNRQLRKLYSTFGSAVE